MRTLAKIVKDKDNQIYLKIYDEEVNVLAFFKIQCYNTKPEGKSIDLSDTFSVDLSGKTYRKYTRKEIEKLAEAFKKMFFRGKGEK